MNFRYNINNHKNCVILKIDTWITPKDINSTSKDFKRHISVFHKRLKNMSFELSNIIGYDHDYIVDSDFKLSGILFGKKSYVSFNIVLFKTKEEISLDLYIKSFEDLIKSDELFDYSQFKFR